MLPTLISAFEQLSAREALDGKQAGVLLRLNCGDYMRLEHVDLQSGIQAPTFAERVAL